MMDFTDRLGFSTASLAGTSLAEASRVGRELGFTAIEFLGFGGYCHSQGELDGFYFERMSDPEREQLRALAAPF
ncbi:MAG: hypothetical protein KKI08_02005, partial [Armatimonadetes bacterium]|nr:hypothetical protein [Armatimonadota bacterium]